MAVKRESRREHNPVRSSRPSARERADKLAPLEERSNRKGRRQAQRDGTLPVDTGELKLPEGLMDETETRSRGPLHLEPVVIFILVCALAYLAFIAYLISTAPSQ